MTTPHSNADGNRAIAVASVVIALIGTGAVLRSGSERAAAHRAELLADDWDFDANWRPALSHPDAPEIINAVLTDWFSNIEEDVRDPHSIYPHRPDLTQVRLLRSQLPRGFVPTVEGVRFQIVDQSVDGSDAALIVRSPGRIALRFDIFSVDDDGSIEIIMCLLASDETAHGYAEGWSAHYRVTKLDDKWVAQCSLIRT